MLNKNLILIGVIAGIVALGGLLFYLSAGDNNKPTAVKSGELTREQAQQMLSELWQQTEERTETVIADYVESEGGYNVSPYISYPATFGKEQLYELAQKNLINIVKDKGLYGNIFTFTNDAETWKYLSEAPPEQIKMGLDLRAKTIKLAEVKGVEVTGLTQRDENTVVAEVLLEYELTPFGEAMKPELSEPQRREAVFVLYDDGWRISQ